MIAQQSVAFIGADPDPALLDHDRALMYPLYRLNLGAWLPTDRNARILDFGCGYGTFLSFLAGEGYLDIRGFDPDTRCANFTRSQGFSVEPGLDSRQFLAANRDRFDCVSVQGVAMYFERDQLVSWFSALRDSLRPGGTILLTAPNAAGWCGLTEFIQDPFMKSVYTDVLLADLCRFAGLEIAYLGGQRLAAKGPKRWLWASARKAWTLALRLIYLLERGRSERTPKSFEATLLLVARRPK